MYTTIHNLEVATLFSIESQLLKPFYPDVNTLFIIIIISLIAPLFNLLD